MTQTQACIIPCLTTKAKSQEPKATLTWLQDSKIMSDAMSWEVNTTFSVNLRVSYGGAHY